MQRLFDVLVSLLVVILLSPVFLILVILVRLKIGSPVIFSQIRPGKNGEPFRLYKFRSMTDIRDDHGDLLSDEKRMTSFGQFLRSSSLDELPEFWNVLLGDMSIVGPRPLLMEYLSLYTTEQMRRHEVRPGITGWAQINGRNAIGWEEKFKLDVWYVDNRSIILDLRIMLMTVSKVFGREGISSKESVTMEKFKGKSNS